MSALATYQAAPDPDTSAASRPWQETAAMLQKHRDATLAAVRPALCDPPAQLPLNVASLAEQLLPSDVKAITESAPEVLLAQLASQKLTATAVTNAFLHRASLAQKLTNCVTELLPERALARAKELDEYIKTHGKPIGPLHGLPISVKEHIPMAGLKTNAGFIAWAENESPQAPILDILWAAGAVFHVRTTQPQTLMHLETSNNIYGVTVNPFNRQLTAGGSSGGEGALIGTRGSCLGVGTDIGGSIRSPAANNGLYGFKPTGCRLPDGGLLATMKGQEQVIPAIGPLSTSLEGIKIFSKVVLDAKPWLKQPHLVSMPWRDDQEWLPKLPNGGKKLKVGVLYDDGVVKPHPPVLRALKEVTEKLEKIEGVELVEWKPYKHDLAWDIISSIYFCDGGIEETAAIEASGEPWRPLSKFIIKDNPQVPTQPYSIKDVWRLTAQREQYRAEYAEAWNRTATGPDGEGMVDVILCPVGPGTAPPLDQARWWGYTSQWNLLNYPAVVFPVTQADPALDAKDASYQPRNERDEFNHKLYEPETYRDAPVSLQLVGRIFEDEKVIEALDYITQRTGLPFADALKAKAE
ncbi:uncharacterized protein K452DRAFT_288411 [Aplosporella prunicola CBS 121167]|uniref:amidase n=1 Tax=Aplosporella prunicola CBS 121167 TaxID=1176127 RepID=A0A6A6BDN7_9PEZI|nr:uncharacterized protein K452DRAFT_288411 [Aplosporella prunicola CBS 121167]KAF2141027.1 hypothetical protein K452DRAFT_288411 [Aplosporella prunicola CBS 121167]